MIFAVLLVAFAYIAVGVLTVAVTLKIDPRFVDKNDTLLLGILALVWPALWLGGAIIGTFTGVGVLVGRIVRHVVQ